MSMKDKSLKLTFSDDVVLALEDFKKEVIINDPFIIPFFSDNIFLPKEEELLFCFVNEEGQKVYIKGKNVFFQIVPRQEQKRDKYYSSISFMLLVFKNNIMNYVINTTYSKYDIKDYQYVARVEDILEYDRKAYTTMEKSLFNKMVETEPDKKRFIRENIFLDWNYLLKVNKKDSRKLVQDFFSTNLDSSYLAEDFWYQMTDGLFKHLGFKAIFEDTHLNRDSNALYSEILLMTVPWEFIYRHPEVYWDISVLIRRDDFDASSMTSFVDDDPINTVPEAILKKYPKEKHARKEMFLFPETYEPEKKEKEKSISHKDYQERIKYLCRNKTINKEMIDNLYDELLKLLSQKDLTISIERCFEDLFANTNIDFFQITDLPYELILRFDWRLLCMSPNFDYNILNKRYIISIPDHEQEYMHQVNLFTAFLNEYMIFYSSNSNVDWEFVRKYPQYFSFSILSENPSFDWNLLYDAEFVNRVNLRGLNMNSNLKWSIVDEINKLYYPKEIFTKDQLSTNPNIPDWFIEEYPQYVNLSLLKRVPWNIIERQLEMKDIDSIKQYDWGAILSSPTLELSIIFKYFDILEPILSNPNANLSIVKYFNKPEPIIYNEEYVRILFANEHLNLNFFNHPVFQKLLRMFANNIRMFDKRLSVNVQIEEFRINTINELFNRDSKQYIYIQPLLEDLTLNTIITDNKGVEEIYNFVFLKQPNRYFSIFPSLYFNSLTPDKLKQRYNKKYLKDYKNNKSIKELKEFYYETTKQAIIDFFEDTNFENKTFSVDDAAMIGYADLDLLRQNLDKISPRKYHLIQKAIRSVFANKLSI